MRIRTVPIAEGGRGPGAKPKAARQAPSGGGRLGFEAELWATADALRGNLEASEYKHVVLGLIFLKFISDAFEERQAYLFRETADSASEYYVPEPAERRVVAEDRDEYVAENVFWVPPEARWQTLLKQARQPGIGQAIDNAMAAIERENPRLRGVLPQI